MTETIPVRVQHKRMSASDWASSSLVLLDGELGVESDTGKVKVGNGRDRFSSLQYLTGPQGQTGPKGDRGETGPRGADGVMRFEELTSQQRESLRGPQGQTGPVGPQGPQGPRGADGRQGPQGLTGPAGPRGPEGQRGPQGNPGPKGDRGNDGAPGQNIINQNGGQPMKYWYGSKVQYDAISNKDANTIYDVYKQE